MPSCYLRKEARGFLSFVRIHTNLPYILIWCHWYLLLFAFMYITMRLHCYDHTVYLPPFFIFIFFCFWVFFLVHVLIVESVNDPYWLLLWVNPVTPPPRFWVAHTWINKGCWLSCVVRTIDCILQVLGYASFFLKLLLYRPRNPDCPAQRDEL